MVGKFKSCKSISKPVITLITKSIFLTLLFSFTNLKAGEIHGFPDSLITNNSYDNLEINELLIDQTQSKVAKDFYDLFYSLWESPVSDIDYSILFEEKPMPSLGTQITITINDLIIFRQFVRPRYETIEEMVNQAISQIYNYLDNYRMLQEQLRFDEMEGTGIY